MVVRLLLLGLLCALTVACGSGGGAQSGVAPSVPPLPSPPEGVPMELVDVGPVGLLLPEDMQRADVPEPEDGRQRLYESREQDRALPAAVLVRVVPDGGDLQERVERHRDELAKTAKIEDLDTAEVPWPGLGDAVELRYTARPFMTGGLPLRTVDRLVLDGDRTVLVSVSAPPVLWDRLALETVVESLRSAS